MSKKTKAIPTDKTSNTAKEEQASVVFRASVSRRRSSIRMVQNVVLLWLDSNFDENDSECRNTIKQLRHVVNEINTFTNDDECIHFLENIRNKKACMVISGSLGKVILPRVHNMSQLDSIFIFCGNRKYHEQWTQEWSKIKGIFTEITPLCDALKQVVQQCMQNSISISFIATTSDIMNKRFNQLEPVFIYSQIMKDIFLTIEFQEKHIQRFVNYCQDTLADNIVELQNVDKLKQQYRQETPIWWYTYECFLHPMLNRALRTWDVDLIVMFGFFIKDLHLQIEQLHNKQFGNQASNKTFVVYRGQGMDKAEFNKLVETKDGLLSFNCFLLTSKKQEIALDFAERATANPNVVGILFVMTINPSQSTAAFAAIGDVGYCKNPDEVLFSMHTVFRINDITSMDERGHLFKMNLTLASDNDPELCVLTDQIQEETFADEKGWYRLGQVLLKMDQPKKAEEVYQTLLEQATTEKEKAPIYHQIGWAKESQGEYEEAIVYYEESIQIEENSMPQNQRNLANSYNNIGLVYYNMGEYLEAFSFHEKVFTIRQQLLPPNHPDLASTYNNIGLMYDELGEYAKALSSYQKALAIRQQSLTRNHPDLAASYNNIGLVYYNVGDYPKALSWHEKALTIRQQSLPPNHPDTATSYNNIGNVYYNVNDYSQALLFHEKALTIRQQSLRPNHPDVAASYNNIGAVYDAMGEYSKALLYHERALAIKQQSLPPNHPDLAMSCGHIGNVYMTIGQNSKAFSFCQRAVDIAQQSLPTNHSHLRWYKNVLDSVKKAL